MPLDDRYADSVRFECEKCLRESALRAISKADGLCPLCGSETWTLITEYHEPEILDRSSGYLPIPTALAEWMGWRRRNSYEGEIVCLRTPSVSVKRALELVRTPFKRRGGLAFAYMEARRDDDAARERERLREIGGQNCLVCGIFFMPVADKPWTQAGCCTKACFSHTMEPDADLSALLTYKGPRFLLGDLMTVVSGPYAGKSVMVLEMDEVRRVAEVTDVDEPITYTVDLTALAPKPKPQLAVDCACGHHFEVRAMYQGTQRACPACGEKVFIR